MSNSNLHFSVYLFLPFIAKFRNTTCLMCTKCSLIVDRSPNVKFSYKEKEFLKEGFSMFSERSVWLQVFSDP